MVPYRKIDHGFTSNQALSKTFLCLVTCYWAFLFGFYKQYVIRYFSNHYIPIGSHKSSHSFYASKGLEVTRNKKKPLYAQCLDACCGHCWHMLRKTSNPFAWSVELAKVCSFGNTHTCVYINFNVSIQEVSFVKD